MRIASVPHGHVYVRHLAALVPDGVTRLPDPRPERPATGAPWWPAVMLSTDWIDANADGFDLYHLHFGFDSVDPAELERIVATLRRHGKPFVYTVHDLRNPHQLDPGAHDAALDVLIPAADALITLTPGAAAEIGRRWGRRAAVIPHPHVVEFEEMAIPRPDRVRPRVGIHLKSLRASIDPLPVLEALADAAPQRGFDLVVDVHTDVVVPGMANYSADVAETLERLGGREHIEVHVHDYYSDDELWDYFRSLDLSVLPYRFGTHSGWLEACYDLGTRVLAPRLGFYHEQEPGVLGYRRGPDGAPSRDDLDAALEAVAGATSPWRAEPQWRRRQREEIAAQHRAVYEAARAEPRR